MKESLIGAKYSFKQIFYSLVDDYSKFVAILVTEIERKNTTRFDEHRLERRFIPIKLESEIGIVQQISSYSLSFNF